MEQSKRRGVRWWLLRAAAFLVCLYAILVIIRVRGLFQEEETQKQVEKIHSTRLTLADVDGTRRPEKPDPLLNDATVEGVDSNHNHVRDDVELYILDTYTNQQERTAWMQWAMSNNILLDYVKDRTTLVAALTSVGRAGKCVVLVYKDMTENNTWSHIKNESEKIEDMIFNTQARVKQKEVIYKNDSSLSEEKQREPCDI
jgi:hypothetical protein